MSRTVKGYGPPIVRPPATWKPEPGTYWTSKDTGRIFVVESVKKTGSLTYKEYVYLYRITNKAFRHRCSLKHFRETYRLAHPSEIAKYVKAPF